MAQFIDDKFENITVDVEKIQAKPNLYISYIGDRAYSHLVKEMVNNVIDEDLNVNSISDGTCDMLYSIPTNTFYIRDHGRGIAFEDLKNACTILQSGTKMSRTHGTSAGENGVGLTATNALSEEFEISSYRNGEARIIKFREGKNVSDETIKIRKKDDHGLQVAFKPSETYLGKGLTLDVDGLKDWLEKLSYTVDSNRIKFKLTIDYDGEGNKETFTYKKSPMGKFLTRFAPEADLLKEPVILSGKTNIIEPDVITRNSDGTVNVVDMDRDLAIDVVINYNQGSEDTVVFSFCNDIETIEHGQHVSAATSCVTNYIRKKVKESIKKGETEVTNTDIQFGLCMVVNLKTSFSRGLFTSQTKHKMDNQNLYDPMKQVINNALDEFFSTPDNIKSLNKIIGVVKENITARQAATKARKKISKKKVSFMETQLISGYVAPNLIGKKTRKEVPFELYILEGDSAGGNARTARFDNDVQGTLGLTGKPSQVYGKLPEQIAKSVPDVKKLFDEILHCGYGEHFSIDNLLYDKIIGATDADIDGSHIFTILLANIYKHARPLLEYGHVYRVKTPLYRLKEIDESKRDKNGNVKIDKSNYIYDLDEYYIKFEESVSKNIKLKFNNDDEDFVKPSQIKKFLQTNRDYFECLDRVSKQRSVNRDILEYVAINPDTFGDTINDVFPELYYDKDKKLIHGGYGLEQQSLLLDKVVMEDIKYLNRIILDGNDGIAYYHTYQKLKSKSELSYLGYLTIGQVMERCHVYLESFSSRFKGLGEMSDAELAALVMNPNNRVLIRITLDEAEDELNKLMDNLFLEEKTDVRKAMVNDYELRPDDIDN